MCYISYSPSYHQAYILWLNSALVLSINGSKVFNWLVTNHTKSCQAIAQVVWFYFIKILWLKFYKSKLYQKFFKNICNANLGYQNVDTGKKCCLLPHNFSTKWRKIWELSVVEMNVHRSSLPWNMIITTIKKELNWMECTGSTTCRVIKFLPAAIK